MEVEFVYVVAIYSASKTVQACRKSKIKLFSFPSAWGCKMSGKPGPCSVAWFVDWCVWQTFEIYCLTVGAEDELGQIVLTYISVSMAA